MNKLMKYVEFKRSISKNDILINFKYRPVDIWSIGVLTYEVLTSKPLYPGESDLDQLHLIINSLGKL